ncbi:TraH family protein [Rhizobium binxianense]
MVDAALIQKCADSSLKPAIVERFIEQGGSSDPLAVTVRSGNRVVLVPQAKTVEAAMDIIRRNIGHNTVRVGITQYPAGVGLFDAGQLKSDLVDACKNVRMGTKLFGKVYRIVVKWYGKPVDEAFEDAVCAWQTGYFEGTAVFLAADPGEDKATEIKENDGDRKGDESRDDDRQTDQDPDASEAETAVDPNKAGMRIDLSGIGGTKP